MLLSKLAQASFAAWRLPSRVRAMQRLSVVVLRVVAALTIVASGAAHGDMWRYSPEVATRTFIHGDVRVVLTTDARTDQVSPDFLFEVFKGETIVYRIPGISFEQLFASSDNEVFLGVSNRGIPGTAVVVFRQDGKVMLLADHRLAEFDYCTRSATVDRVWFDEADANVRFQLDERAADPGIYIRSCRG